MPSYYALYIDDTIKAVFSTSEFLHQWVRVIYQPLMKKMGENVTYTAVTIDGLSRDENYSIYLVHAETDETKQFFFSSVDEAERKTAELKAENRRTRLAVIRIVIDYPYLPGCLETDFSLLYRHPIRRCSIM